MGDERASAGFREGSGDHRYGCLDPKQIDDRSPCESDQSNDDERAGARIVPLPAQQLRVRVPTGRRITAVRFLVAKREAQYKETNGAIELEVPSIGLHEVVAIDFAG